MRRLLEERIKQLMTMQDRKLGIKDIISTVKDLNKFQVGILLDYLVHGYDIEEELHRVSQRKIRKLEDKDKLSPEDLKLARQKAQTVFIKN